MKINLKNFIKKKYLLIILTSISLSCQPEDGIDGYNSLVKITKDNNIFCPNGGIIVYSGLDVNRNNSLETSEYQSSQYICNGQDGADSNFILTTTLSDRANQTCGTNLDGIFIGGVEMIYGYDLNSDGILDNDEILSTIIVCNGTDGISGYNALISIDYIEMGTTTCAYGGIAINYGLDTNLNGILDPGEIQGTDVNCKSKYMKIIEGSKLWDATNNQGLTNDGTYYYVSTTHTDIEKRRISDHIILATNGLTSKYGGLFYDVDNNEILTAAGVYKPPHKAYVNRLSVDDLSSIKEIDLSAHFNYGINAIVKLNGVIYIGETSVGFDVLPKKWKSFDSNFNYIQDVYSSVSKNGINDWQDATVYENKIYATDHEGFINVFTIKSDGTFNLEYVYDSNYNNHEGITHINGDFKLHKYNDGIYEVKVSWSFN